MAVVQAGKEEEVLSSDSRSLLLHPPLLDGFKRGLTNGRITAYGTYSRARGKKPDNHERIRWLSHVEALTLMTRLNDTLKLFASGQQKRKAKSAAVVVTAPQGICRESSQQQQQSATQASLFQHQETQKKREKWHLIACIYIETTKTLLS